MDILLSASDWLHDFGKAFVEKFLEEIKIGDIGADINEGILQWRKTFFCGDFKLLITDAIIVTWIALIAAFIVFGGMAAKAQLKPSKKQTFIEMLVGLVISTSMGFGMTKKEAEHVAPMIGTLAIMIMACNVISAFKISPPAKNIAFPVALALFAIFYVIYVAIRFVGFKGFGASLTTPMKALLPFKILDYLIKPVSLALRLFGNVFGAFVFMEFLYIIIPVVIPGVFGLWFDIADGILQAVVFSYLTMSYIGEAVEVGHELKEHEEKELEKLHKEEAVASV